LLGNQTRLTFDDRLEDPEPEILEPKEVKRKSAPELKLGDGDMNGKFYVYGYGHLEGGYDQLGKAIVAADTLSGVVTDDMQLTLWERGNRDLSFTLEDFSAYKAADSASMKEEALGKVASYMKLEEGDGTEYLDLTGCEIEQTLYLVNHKRPIVVMTGADACVIVYGYGEDEIQYVDPSDGETHTCTYEEMDKMAKKGGGVMLTGR